MNLWFDNSFGNKRIIADCATPQEVSAAIDKFIDECNAKKPATQQPFKSYYTRIWEDPDTGMVKYDVGSWSEFFYWEGPISAYSNSNGSHNSNN